MWPGKVSTGIMYTRMPEAERKRVTSMALRYHDVRRAVGGSARPVEAEARDVLEVRRVEGPEGRPVRERARGDGEVHGASPGASRRPVEVSRDRRLSGPERDGGRGREQGFLGPELLGRPRPAQPLVQRQGADAEALPRLDGRADLRGGAPVAREGVHERREIEVDHRPALRARRRLPARREARISFSSASTSRAGRGRIAGTTRSKTSSRRRRSSSEGLPLRSSWSRMAPRPPGLWGLASRAAVRRSRATVSASRVNVTLVISI